MRTSNSTILEQQENTPALISRLEIALLCSAAILLAAAYPTREHALPQVTPVASPATTDKAIQLEAKNDHVQIVPTIGASGLLERIDTEVIVEITASKPAS